MYGGAGELMHIRKAPNWTSSVGAPHPVLALNEKIVLLSIHLNEVYRLQIKGLC